MPIVERHDLVKLDERTQSRLRSTQILTSLPQIIAELVQNSLDAGAQHIDVGVDNEEWACCVRDDGKGISKEGLNSIAQRYASSKAYDPSSLDNVTTFGFRGEALASAADISCLETSSRTSRAGESRSVILKGGQKLYEGSSMRWRREIPGTTVSVRDAFYNLPIRRLSHPNTSRTLELIRHDLEAYALVFPHVSFTLEDTAKERQSGSGKGRIMTIAKTTSTLVTFRKMFGRALVEHVEEVSQEAEGMKLEGYLSLDGAHSKAYQFIYVNRHLLDTCDLHRIIERKFASSSFAKHAYDETGKTKSPRPETRRSPRKIEKRPVYVLMLNVPPRHLDNCLEPAKTAVQFRNQDAVTQLICDVVDTFLVKHGFKNKSSRLENDRLGTRSPSPRKKRKIAEITKAQSVDVKSYCQVSTSQTMSRPLATVFPLNKDNPILVPENPTLDGESAEIEWTDPQTGRTYIVDTRTGNSFLKGRDTRDRDENEGDDSGNLRLSKKSSRRTIVDTRSLRKLGTTPFCRHSGGDDENRNYEKGNEMPKWIQKALQGNEAFRVTEPGIRAANAANTSSAPNTQYRYSDQKEHSQRRYLHSESINRIFQSGSLFPIPSGSLAREDLASAHVIYQVDRKFIACLVQTQHRVEEENATDANVHSSSSGRTLLLVDQHAADERIRVERYLKGLCEGFLEIGGRCVEVTDVDPAKPVLLTKVEKFRLVNSSAYQEAFRRWGFHFLDMQNGEDMNNDEDEGYVQVYVSGIPEIVAEKLLAGDELREVIKGYLARLDSEDIEHVLKSDTDDRGASMENAAWLKGLRWCPQELVNLVNSRACRGAIMFNDPLSIDQCKRLIRQLSETAFPFQCAHGRPSLIPLAHVGPTSDGLSRVIDWSRLSESEKEKMVSD